MKARTKKIVEILKETYPDAKCELNYETPLQLLVATVLSAQTTDKKVNEVTKELFKDYPDLDAFLEITNDELEERIKQIGLYRNKSKNLILMFRQIKEKFNGEVPTTMEGITSLAGAGRKTANVVLSNAFGVPSIAVDTHVFRVSNRLGLAESDKVLEVEKQLQKELPKKEWTLMHHLLIFHGRRCCTARNPKCEECPLSHICKYDK
ncbi:MULTISPECIES: endonuclease III [Clostridium]|jgi:endonuclease-3|uniref:Endonuclease III n=2 Tax=Clostridium butyricum TaxID=1492 RepID=C4IE04_CLOBU|nr:MULTISPECIES: endonuclease III [Clostridium]ETI89228.1 MAG: Endonuclease III [Clostridium butyricum DORA_1]APF24515.1 endonuclease III [Clostridium butyricum]AXB86017.1 endonuclease III [Clostridium butyricum]EDT73987.1 endonuclease III [Clostridium butyricum 5521]EEP55397.1 endonuclease III [Clostridium butyricum E4 str. BoNT E BL5262]